MTTRGDHYDWTEPAERLIFARWFLGISLLVTLALTYPIFTAANRSFPLIPLVPALSVSSPPFDVVVLVVLFGAAALFSIAPSPRTISLFLGLVALLVLQDQNRLQSWLLFYALMLGAYIPLLRKGARQWSPEQTLGLLQGITWATCFWSGVQKLNPEYFTVMVPGIAEAITHGVTALELPLRWCLSLIPVCEIVGALLLLPRATRSYGVAILVATNITMLIAAGPIGITWHRCGWPWLMAIAFLTPRLFWRSQASASHFLKPPGAISKTVFWTSCLILPLLGFFGRWDLYLSFGLFSGRAASGSALVEQSAFNQLPKVVRKASERTSAEGYYRIHLQHWSELETGAPPSAQGAVLRLDAQKLCSFVAPEEPLVVGIEHPSRIPWVGSNTIERLSCENSLLLPMPEKESLPEGAGAELP